MWSEISLFTFCVAYHCFLDDRAPFPYLYPSVPPASSFCSIHTNLPTSTRNSRPHPLTQAILDQTGKNHQILRRNHHLLAHCFPRRVLELATGLQRFSLLADTGDSPKQQGAYVARYRRRESVERSGHRADCGDGARGVEGEEIEGRDDLGKLISECL